MNTASGLILCHWSPRGKGEKASKWKQKWKKKKNEEIMAELPKLN